MPEGTSKDSPGRARQKAGARAWILENKPWLRSTGPRTPEGMARCKGNATKHGGYSREVQEALRALRAIEDRAAELRKVVAE